MILSDLLSFAQGSSLPPEVSNEIDPSRRSIFRDMDSKMCR